MDSRDRYDMDGEREMRAWRARERPDNELPVAVALNVIVGSSDEAVAFISGATVYRNGVELALDVRAHPSAPSVRRGASLTDPFDRGSGFSLAVEYADGRRHVLGRAGTHRSADGPDAVHLLEQSGSAGLTSSTSTYFLTPVPPEAQLVVHFEHPIAGIARTRTLIPTSAIAEAARKVQVLWPAAGATDAIAPPSPAGSAVLDAALLARLFDCEITPLVRTDFSDDAAWETVVRQVIRPVDFDDPETYVNDQEDQPDLADISRDIDDPEHQHLYGANLEAIDDRANAGLVAEQLPDLLSSGDETFGYVLLADDRSITEARAGGELTLVYVDLASDLEDDSWPGRSFRVLAHEIASIEANLAISNMEFAAFADHADGDDGVFRGFRDG